jgi:NAD(P)H-flavin reductase/hemoglobin-like flavoprotein
VADTDALKVSFARVAEHGDEVPLYFYSYLFLRHPALRGMFAASMSAQRDRLVGALGRIVADVDRAEALVPFLEALGRDHRKFAVVADHYPQVGEALLATLQHFLADEWTAELAALWEGAYGVIADVMVKAAEADAAAPAWWDAEIVEHDRRRPDLAVIRVRPEGAVRYLPGQSLSVETAHRPRMWRYYSPANAPRADGLLEFHVRAVDGGWVSSALVMSAGPGDVLRLGPPVGDLYLDESSTDPILMIGGGTGLAPLRAMVEQLALGGARRGVHLYVEARTEPDLYDLPALTALAAELPWLTVLPVVRSGRSGRYPVGTAAELVLGHDRWARRQVYLCGGPAMVTATRERLVGGGLDERRIRVETFDYLTVPLGPDRADGGTRGTQAAEAPAVTLPPDPRPDAGAAHAGAAHAAHAWKAHR